MYAHRPLNDRIDRYTGPYERWVFSDELGKPFAFPAIRDDSSDCFTALLEGGDTLPSDPALETRLPPLWNPLSRPRVATPFAFRETAPAPALGSDARVARLLACLHRPAAGLQPRFKVNFPIAPQAWTPAYDTTLALAGWVPPATRPRAIIGVIDDGLPFANRAFLGQDGRTRVSHVWLQSARAASVSAVPFGHELVNGTIDTLRRDAGGDEDLIYRRAGAIETALPELGAYLRRHTTHGAHVMAAAAGNARAFASQPLGDDVLIIAVQLPNTIAWDTSGFGKDMYMLAALHYILQRARAIADHYAADPLVPVELPLYVNFSYGWNASRHDGQSEIELAVEQLLSERRGLQPQSFVVMPTGNQFNADMHGQITRQDLAGDSFAFGWQILPDDRTSSYLEIWFPEGFDPKGFVVSVAPPPGFAVNAGSEIPVTPDPVQCPAGDPRRFVEVEIGGQIVGQLSADKHRGNRWRVLLALVPSVFARGQTRRAPSGLWRLQLRRTKGPRLSPQHHINVWVQRDDDPTSLQSGGQQSRLVDLAAPAPGLPHPLRQYTQNLGFIRGYGALNGVASASLVTRVAGFTASTGRPSHYSGSGGLARKANGQVTPWGAQTQVAAVADISAMLPGTPSAGVRSGATSVLVGTSGAAPLACRALALGLAMGPALPLHRVEEATPLVMAKHLARVGTATVPPARRQGGTV